jgi:hypothetical protein
MAQAQFRDGQRGELRLPPEIEAQMAAWGAGLY